MLEGGSKTAPINRSNDLDCLPKCRGIQIAEHHMLFLSQYHPNISNYDTRNTKKDLCMFQVCLVSIKLCKDLEERMCYEKQD